MLLRTALLFVCSEAESSCNKRLVYIALCLHHVLCPYLADLRAHLVFCFLALFSMFYTRWSGWMAALILSRVPLSELIHLFYVFTLCLCAVQTVIDLIPAEKWKVNLVILAVAINLINLPFSGPFHHIQPSFHCSNTPWYVENNKYCPENPGISISYNLKYVSRQFCHDWLFSKLCGSHKNLWKTHFAVSPCFGRFWIISTVCVPEPYWLVWRCCPHIVYWCSHRFSI